MWNRGSWGDRCRKPGFAFVACLAFACPSLADDTWIDLHSSVRMADGGTNQAVRSALQRAARRLSQPACESLLSEFQDASGRTLEAVLQESGRGVSEHMRALFFYDGTGTSQCQVGHVLAFTTLGSRVVLICPVQFQSQERNNASYTDVVIIHEILHTLGLGENPPSSREINARVFSRCVALTRAARK